MRSFVICILIVFFIQSCKTQTKSDFDCFNGPQLFLKYNQKVSGYDVKVMWFPGVDVRGPAILCFEGEEKTFKVFSGNFEDYSAYDKYLADGVNVISTDYQHNKEGEILSSSTPFFFSDIDFDGKDELLISNINCGVRGVTTYDVYKIVNGNDGTFSEGIERMMEKPLSNLNSLSKLDPTEKTVTLVDFSTRYNNSVSVYQKEIQTADFLLIEEEVVSNDTYFHYKRVDGQLKLIEKKTIDWDTWEQ